jgi:hypothetical protein
MINLYAVVFTHLLADAALYSGALTQAAPDWVKTYLLLWPLCGLVLAAIAGHPAQTGATRGTRRSRLNRVLALAQATMMLPVSPGLSLGVVSLALDWRTKSASSPGG